MKSQLSNTIAETDSFLASIITSKKPPSNLDFYLYLLAKEFGITELDKYPIPYLESLIKTHIYVKEQEQKRMKKQHNKR